MIITFLLILAWGGLALSSLIILIRLWAKWGYTPLQRDLDIAITGYRQVFPITGWVIFGWFCGAFILADYLH